MVFGFIRVNPVCPVDPVRHVCSPHPLGHVEVRALAPTTKVAASARTKADGHFSLRLRPGRYVFVVLVPGPFPKCPRQLVSIRSATTFHAEITCDAGIRLPGSR
jgi:hypothetical protein